MYLHKTPSFVPKLFPNFTWNKPGKEKCIYLTFDDGPIPVITEYVLDQLNLFNAKASFFCVGANILRHPEIFNSIISHGHSIGNHTQDHLKGWNVDTKHYLDNIEKCQQSISAYSSKKLFRPPYGKMKREQSQIVNNDYEIIMWDVLSGDFDKKLSPESCLKNSINATEAGSIIVFHDNIKAKERLEHVLPRYLEYFSKAGYRFEGL